MASIPSILGRKAFLPAAAAAAALVVGSSSVIAGGGGRRRRFDEGDREDDDDDAASSSSGRARRSPPRLHTTTTASCEATTTTTTTTPPPERPPSSSSSFGASWSAGRGYGMHDRNPFLAPELPETVLRKRMTAVGRFSLKSETDDNRSIPVFFLALSGEKTTAASTTTTTTTTTRFSPRPTDSTFSVSDFEEAWIRRDMPTRHPRFHSVVCPERVHFEETHRLHPPSSSSSSRSSDSTGGGGGGGERGEDDDGGDETGTTAATSRIKAELDRHASETSHFGVYREDMRERIERMLTSPLDVRDRLWEVKISNGPLGSSGAICRTKADAILSSLPPPPPTGTTPRRRLSPGGGPWRDAADEGRAGRPPTETVLLFRCHHALADGSSIVAALSDLCDEADEIRANIEEGFEEWRRRGGRERERGFLRRILVRLIRLVKICAWFAVGTARALVHQGYLQITTRANPFDAVREDARGRGPVPSGRSISWCDAAPLDEVKGVARSIGKAKGVTITVNDMFVSCVTAAVSRQLVEHEEYAAAIDSRERKYAVPTINVVVPVHLGGGVVLPGESVGNNIGAFVARCPGEMKRDAAAASGGGGRATCPTERLVRVHESLLRSKGGPAPLVSHHIARFCSDHLPDGITNAIFRRANANAAVVVSNNRGYDGKLHIRGMAVESAAGFLPLPPGIPIGVVVQSYAGTVSLTVTAEKWAVPDADKFLSWVLDDYRRLHEEASKLAK